MYHILACKLKLFMTEVLEQVEIQEYSTPPDLPDAMKPMQGGEVEQQ